MHSDTPRGAENPTSEITRLQGELQESLTREWAIWEILRAIAESSRDAQVVLDTIAEYAARLCDADDAAIMRLVGDSLISWAHHGDIPTHDAPVPVTRGSVTGRCLIDRTLVHVPNLAAESEVEFPEGRAIQRETGARTHLAVPLISADRAIGTLVLRRTEVRPFSNRQIAIVETVADQAVIAIENERLFPELDPRNRELTEALEHQTATGEILRVIAGAPTDLQHVLDAVVETAARLCQANDALLVRIEGNANRLWARYGSVPAAPPNETQPWTRRSCSSPTTTR